MRIAIISYWVCPLTRIGESSGGGMSIYILNLANQLVNLGHYVDIYTRSHNDKDENILDLNSNTRIIHLPSQLSITQDTAELFADKIINFVSNNYLSYDLIHSHYYLSALAGIKFQKFADIPHFVTFHTLGEAKKKYLNIENKFRIISERKITKTVDCIIVSTEIEKNDLIKYYKTDGKLIEIVFPGVNHKIFRKISRSISRQKIDFPKSKFIILFVGRIDPVKGIRTLIEAVSMMLNKNQKYRKILQVILIGGNSQMKKSVNNKELIKIRKMITKMNLPDVIKLVGSKPNKLLPFYYNSADITVLPSVYESFGLVIIEAMACGCAVVASNIGGPKYLIKDGINGRLFESGNAVNLSDILIQIYSNSKLRMTLGNNAILSSNRYCWSKQINKMVKIYKKYL